MIDDISSKFWLTTHKFKFSCNIPFAHNSPWLWLLDQPLQQAYMVMRITSDATPQSITLNVRVLHDLDLCYVFKASYYPQRHKKRLQCIWGYFLRPLLCPSSGISNIIMMSEKMFSCSRVPKWIIIISAPPNADIRGRPQSQTYVSWTPSLLFCGFSPSFLSDDTNSPPVWQQLGPSVTCQELIFSHPSPIKCCIYTAKGKESPIFHASQREWANEGGWLPLILRFNLLLTVRRFCFTSQLATANVWEQTKLLTSKRT